MNFIERTMRSLSISERKAGHNELANVLDGAAEEIARLAERNRALLAEIEALKGSH